MATSPARALALILLLLLPAAPLVASLAGAISAPLTPSVHVDATPAMGSFDGAFEARVWVNTTAVFPTGSSVVLRLPLTIAPATIPADPPGWIIVASGRSSVDGRYFLDLTPTAPATTLALVIPDALPPATSCPEGAGATSSWNATFASIGTVVWDEVAFHCLRELPVVAAGGDLGVVGAVPTPEIVISHPLGLRAVTAHFNASGAIVRAEVSGAGPYTFTPSESLVEGEYVLETNATADDDTGRSIAYVAAFSFALDASAPSIEAIMPIGPLPSVALAFDVSDQGGVATVEARLVQAGATRALAIAQGEGARWLATGGDAPDGEHALEVRASDVFGHDSGWEPVYTFHLLQAAPAVTFVGESPADRDMVWSNSSPTFAWTLNDTSENGALIVKIGEGPSTTVESPWTLPVDSAGRYEVSFATRNDLHESTVGAYVLLYDDVTPAFGEAPPAMFFTSRIDPTLSYGRAGGAIDAPERLRITDVAAATWSDITVDERIALALDSKDDGRYAFTFQLVDEAGNAGDLAESTIVLDRSGPRLTDASHLLPLDHTNALVVDLHFEVAEDEGSPALVSVLLNGTPVDAEIRLAGEGRYEFAVSTSDAAGNPGGSTEGVIIIDRTAPHGTIVVADGSQASVFDGPVQVALDLWAETMPHPAPLARTQCSDGDVPVDLPLRVAVDGPHAFTCLIEDVAGNIFQTPIRRFWIDSETPVVTIDGFEGLVGALPQRVNATDDSGIAAVDARLVSEDGSLTQLLLRDAGDGTWDIDPVLVDDGPYQLEVKATAREGLSHATFIPIAAFTLVTHVLSASSDPPLAELDAKWQRDASHVQWVLPVHFADVWVESQDAGGEWVKVPSEGHRILEGAHAVRFRTVDALGHVAGAVEVDLWLDVTPPSIAFTAQTRPAGGAWFSEPVSFAWSCSDGISGVLAPSVMIALDAEGAEQDLVATCEDRAGNVATDRLVSLGLDLTAPQMVFVGASPASHNGWYGATTTFTWRCEDVLSGVVAEEVTATLEVEGEGLSVAAACQDLAGHVVPATLADLRADLTAPNIAAIGADAEAVGGWFLGPVNFSWSCSDALSGIPGGRERVNAFVAEEGVHLVEGECIDTAGRVAKAVTTLRLDRHDPEIALVGASSEAGSGWFTEPTEFTWNCTDTPEGSGVLASTVTAMLDVEGIDLSIEGTCTDVAGRSATATLTGLRLDATAPVVHVADVRSGPAGAISWTVEEAHAVADTRVTISSANGAWTLISGEGNATFEGLAPGTYDVLVVATDAAGNTGQANATLTVISPPPPPPPPPAPATPSASELLFAPLGPAAAFDAPTRVAAGESVAFRAATQPDGAEVAYAWAFGDGARGEGRIIQHAWLVPGEYAVTLAVTTPSGASATALRMIRVAAPIETQVVPSEQVIDDALPPLDDEAQTPVVTSRAIVPSGIVASPARVRFEAPANATIYWRPVGATEWRTGREAEVGGDGIIGLDYYALGPAGREPTRSVTLTLDGFAPVVSDVTAEPYGEGVRVKARIIETNLVRVSVSLVDRETGERTDVPVVLSGDGLEATIASRVAAGIYDAEVVAWDGVGRSAEATARLVVGEHALDANNIERASIPAAERSVPAAPWAWVLLALALIGRIARKRDS